MMTELKFYYSFLPLATLEIFYSGDDKVQSSRLVEWSHKAIDSHFDKVYPDKLACYHYWIVLKFHNSCQMKGRLPFYSASN